MNNSLKVEIVMLPAEKSSRLIKRKDNSLGYMPKEYNLSDLKTANYEPYYLYILSGIEIKGEDYYYNIPLQEVGIATETNHKLIRKDNNRKIEASTDKSLGLPQPSPEFLEKYVKLFNEKNIIRDAVIEMDRYWFDNEGAGQWIEEPKKDKKGYITLRKYQEDWNDIRNEFFKYEKRIASNGQVPLPYNIWLTDYYNPPTLKK